MLLKDVLATNLLLVRPVREVNTEADAQIAAALLAAKPQGRMAVWTEVSRLAKLLCKAQSAGVSIFANGQCDELTWMAVSGTLQLFASRRFPRRHSLCGVCFEHAAPQLFINPHLYFEWIAQAGITISEGLVAPLANEESIYGTVWLMTRDDQRYFDAEDARLLGLLGKRVISMLG